MNKKAVFFTILAIALLSLFLLSFTFYSLVQTRKSIQKRIETLNNFVFSLEKDLSRQLYISGFRIIFLLEDEIIRTGDYIEDVDSAFTELFFYATLNGKTSEKITELMGDATFSKIQEALNEKAKKVNVNINLTNRSLTVSQENPWFIKIDLEVDLLVEDKGGLASWNKTYTITTNIPVEKFEDPLYFVETGGLVTNKINRTIYEDFVQGADVSNLQKHVEDSLYIASTSAPSFIDRLQGIKTPNENGIESLIYLPKLSAQGIPIKEKTCVDYIYFSVSNPQSHHIQDMPNWFMIDDAHLNTYGVAGLTID